MKVTLLCNGKSEVSWYIANKLRQNVDISLQVILQSAPGRRSLSSRLFDVAKPLIFGFFNRLLGTNQPSLVARPNLAAIFVTDDLNTDSVYDRVQQFGPNIIAISGTKKIHDRLLKLAPLALNLHHGMCPIYRGVSSVQWVIFERNYNYFFVTVHRAVSSLDAGEIYGARQLIPRFPEPYSVFRRRLLFDGADLLIEILSEPERTKTGISQTSALRARNLRHRDKPGDFENSVKTIASSADWWRYSAIQAASLTRISSALRPAYLKAARGLLPFGLYVVTYHDICSADEAMLFASRAVPGIYTTRDTFREHLAYYRSEFQLVNLPDGLRQLKNGECKQNSLLAITVDDGLKSSQFIIDELNNLGIAPTCFVCGDPLIHDKPLANHAKLHTQRFLSSHDGRGQADFDSLLRDGWRRQKGPFADFVSRSYFSVGELKALADGAHISLGSHTCSHRSLFGLGAKEQVDEISVSHRNIEKCLGVGVDMFSFPFGKLDQRDLLSHYTAAETAKYVFDCNGGINQNGGVPGNLLRIGIHNEGLQELSDLLSVQWVR